jgi:protein MpaA
VTRRSRFLGIGIGAVLLIVIAAAVAHVVGAGKPATAHRSAAPLAGTPSARATRATTGAETPRPSGRPSPSWESATFGRSVQGRPLVVWHLAAPGAALRVLVVGCIHGNEPAGINVVHMVLRSASAPGIELWAVPDLNPDGVAAGRRQNADRVDLNRNFPFDWQPLGRPGDQQYSGPFALSEPESRSMYALMLRIRPQVSVWFHQPLAVVDRSGGSAILEQRFAVAAGLPLEQLPRYPGSAVGWENHQFANATAFVVELPAAPAQALYRRLASAVLQLAALVR